MLTATFISTRKGWVDESHFDDLRAFLQQFYTPYEKTLKSAEVPAIIAAMKLDKKNVGGKVNCILTRGPGRMERTSINSLDELATDLADFLESLP